MPEITAQAVKDLRDRTGLPMMDCKRALQESGGDPEKAVELLRKEGKKTMEKRAGRATSTGRIAVYTDFAGGVGTMVDLRCESAPVAANDQFVQLANDLAKQLAIGPGATSAEELLAQRSPSQPQSHLEAAVRGPEQPHSRGVQARAAGADQRRLRRATPITTAPPA